MNVIQFPLRENAAEQERAIAGMVLVAPRLWDTAKQIDPEDCTDLLVRQLYHVLHAAAERSVPFDPIALRALSNKIGKPLNEDQLQTLMDVPCVLEKIDWHVSTVLERSREMKLKKAIKATQSLDADSASEAAITAVEEYRARAPRAAGFDTLTIGEVPDPGPTRWLIDGLWISGGVGFIAGEPKAKKSLFTCAAAVAVATGRKLLNRFQALQSPVVMFNAEDRMSETARRIRRMGIAEGVSPRELDNIHLLNITGLRLNKPDDMRKLSATVARIKPGLVVLDPFRNLFDGNEDNSSDVNDALAPLRTLQREHDCAVIVVHHMSKQTEVKRRTGQRMRGSSALHGWGDSNLYIDLVGDSKVSGVEVEQRYADPCETFGWEVRDQRTPDGDALWCEPCGIPSKAKSDEQKSAASSTNEALLLRAIRDAKTPMAAGHLSKQLQMRRNDVFAAIRKLADENAIEQAQREIVDARGRNTRVSGWVIRGASNGP